MSWYRGRDEVKRYGVKASKFMLSRRDIYKVVDHQQLNPSSHYNHQHFRSLSHQQVTYTQPKPIKTLQHAFYDHHRPIYPEEGKNRFLAAFPIIAGQTKALPMVLGVSGGPIIAEDGARATSFKFVQTIAFATKEDVEAFKNSEWVAKSKAAAEARGMAEPHAATFEVEFPKDQTKPKAFTQISRITFRDEASGDEARKAWAGLCSVIGKETAGGKSVGDESKTGLGLIGWDSLEEAGSLKTVAGAKEAWEKYHSFGDCKDVMVKLEVY